MVEWGKTVAFPSVRRLPVAILYNDRSSLLTAARFRRCFGLVMFNVIWMFNVMLRQVAVDNKIVWLSYLSFLRKKLAKNARNSRENEKRPKTRETNLIYAVITSIHADSRQEVKG